MIDFVKAFTQTEPLKVFYNVGATVDLSTGDYVPGLRGDMILNGGVAAINGVCGPGNSFKSTFFDFCELTILERYPETTCVDYDTEATKSVTRKTALARACAPNIADELATCGRYGLTDVTKYNGAEFYDLVKKSLADRSKGKEKKIETPMKNTLDGSAVTWYPAAMVGIDSYSLFQTPNLDDYQDIELGSKKRNMENMSDGRAKTAMFMELPGLAAKTGSVWFLTAHLGDRIQMDPMQPLRKQLSFLKANLKLKNVPEKFMFLTNNLWYMENSGLLIDDNKAPKYPRSSKDNIRGETDLMVIRCINLRPKSGPAGVPLNFVVSQKEGILRDMTHFYYAKEINKGYGFDGNNVTYYLDFYPELKMNRNQVRQFIDEDPKFRRALELNSELCQYYNMNPDIDESMYFTPKELYEGIKEMGYDWDILLQTRGYWTFDHYTNPVKPLSALDLINMKLGIYRPWWYDEYVKSDK